jgi:hypothetical protein
VIIPLQILLATMLRRDDLDRRMLALAVATLFLANLVDSIYADSLLENNEHYVLARKFHELQIDPMDLVFVTHSNVADTSAYFFGMKPRVMSLAQRAVAPNADEALHEAEEGAAEALARGFRVFLSGNELSSLWEPTSVKWNLEKRPGDQVGRLLARLGAELEPRFEFRLDGQQVTMYQLAR